MDGVLFDNFGFDYGNDAPRCQQIVALARAKTLGFVLNAWDPVDVFETSGITLTGPLEYYLFESFGIQNDLTVAQDASLKAAQTAKWRWLSNRQLLNRVFATTTSVT